MARKTFGRSGETIVIDEPENRSVVQLINGQHFDDNNVAIDGGGTYNGTELAFESVGDGTVTGVAESDTGTDTSTESGYTDPATATAPRTKRKWTRRSGITKDGERKKVSQFLTTNLTSLLESLHSMGAALLNEPELNIDKDEAQLLNDALVKMATEYGFGAIISPKTQASIDMCIALGTVYGPRAMSIYRKHGKKQRPVAVMPNASSVQ